MSKKWPYGKLTTISSAMFTSQAFLALNGSAVKVLILFLGKRDFSSRKDRNGQRQYVCENADQLTMTYIELEASPFNFTRPRISRAIDDLLAKGFVRIVDPGGCYKQHKAVYSLSEQWRQWKPGMVIFQRCKDATRGYQGQRAGATA